MMHREQHLEGDSSAGAALWEWGRVWQEAAKTPRIPTQGTNERDALRKRATGASLPHASPTALLGSAQQVPAEHELWSWRRAEGATGP